MQFEDQMTEIEIGQKYDCWRHKVFLQGSCEKYPNHQSKLQLSNFDKFAGFSNNQINIIISFLQHITEDQDYELIELLINIFTIPNEEARQYMLDGGNSYDGGILSDFQRVLL